MSKRYQESNWLVKLWRRRHYVYIPFKYIWYMYIIPMKIPETEYDDELCMVTVNGKETTPEHKQLWGILEGSAQCDMDWVYTSEEVQASINKEYGITPEFIDSLDDLHKDMKVLDENGNEEDELLSSLINESFRTGNTIMASVDEDGNITKEIKDEN